MQLVLLPHFIGMVRIRKKVTTFQMHLELITQHKYLSLGYTFKNNPDVFILAAAYAQLTTHTAAHNQLLLNVVDEFLTWSGIMRAKPSKVFCPGNEKV